MSEQSEEMRLADVLERAVKQADADDLVISVARWFVDDAAAELRMLHIEVEELQGMREEVLHYQREFHRLRDENETLREQRDALLGALRFYAENMGRRTSDNEPFLMTAIEYDCGDRARAAIDAARSKE